ncbi:recombinase family protein [Mycolicibacterium brumae]|nr:recombinase family protein [Mycolicibacterium brumae]
MARQAEDCDALAERNGWPIVARYDDNDLSAFTGRTRPGFESMLTAMAAGEFDALVCWHTDRLYRSMKDLERLIDIADSRGVQIRTVQGGDLDLSNSSGRMLARILGSVARAESEHKGERHRRANEQAAAAGKWSTANRPFGYTRTGEPLEPEASMVRAAACDVLAGKSVRQVAREWRETGLTGTRGAAFSSQNVRALLVNPRYAALRVHRGKIVGPGTWEPLIDETTHRGLVAYLGDPARVICTSFEKKYIGSGVYLCGRCGGVMRHAVSGNPTVRRYECKDHQHVVARGEPVDAYVETLVLGRLARTNIHVMLDAGEKVDVDGLHSQRAAVQARLDELAALFAEGVIDGSQLRRGTAELRSQMAELDATLAEVSRRSPVADLLAAGDAVAERWETLSADLKSKIIQELMTVTILPAPRGSKGFNPERVRVEWR